MPSSESTVLEPERSRPVLVLGANGFLGSHVVRALLRRGRTVRASCRRGCDSRGINGLPVERVESDVLDARSLGAAMRGCGTVFHCVVDTRAWRRDAPFRRVNVDGLRSSMEAALASGISRFVFTSTLGTIGRNPSGVATERDAFNWGALAGDYIRSRVEAEALFTEYCARRGLPGVALCVANTFGPRDYGPTPHGQMVFDAARGRLPITWDGRLSIVGIEDAAEALLLAEERGGVGERYIVSERAVSLAELFGMAAAAYGRRPLFLPLPRAALHASGLVADGVARLLGTSFRLSRESIRLTHVMSDMDATRARTELGWRPRPTEESIGEAIRFYRQQQGRR